MSKKRTFADLRRMLVRRLDSQDDIVLRDLRDDLWEKLIVRRFMCGQSVDYVASVQPNWQRTVRVEDALRRQMKLRSRRGGKGARR